MGNAYRARAPERRVAAMDGIGDGWIDTLRVIAGRDIVVDTLIGPILSSFEGDLLGLQEPWYTRVRINTDLATYILFSREVGKNQGRSFSYVHPPELAYPAVVLAHEFGHEYQFRHPEWQGWPAEFFADRFAFAMMALRGWMPLNTSSVNDVRLYHALRLALWQSEWERNGER